MRFITSSSMSEIDSAAVDEHGLTESALMENAGRLTARHARQYFLEDPEQSVGVICGKGHNGADGMVISRWLAQWGFSVQVYLMTDETDYSGLPERQLQSLKEHSGLSLAVYPTSNSPEAEDLWVDAMLGTGLSGDPRSPYDEAINYLNHQSSPVVSVDVPSGLSGNDNLPFDPCIQAELTVTFGLPKLGLLLEPGYSLAGMIIVQEIGFPSSLYEEYSDGLHLISPNEIQDDLPDRSPTDHKGRTGRLTVLGGSENYTGAPFLVGNSASRVGSGLTALIGPDNLSELAGPAERDLIYPYTLKEVLSSKQENQLGNFMKRQDAFVIGPGLGQSKTVEDGLKDLLPELTSPVVLDADGLNNLSDELSLLSKCRELILTPHPGEASRLLNWSIERTVNEPLECVRRLVDETGQTVVFKTSRPIVGHPDGIISVNVSGSAALAKAGSGDVLSGILGGLLAQGLDVGNAVCLGLYLHGAAGRHAAEALGTLSVRSHDLVQYLSEAIKELKDQTIPDWYPVKFKSQHDEVLHWKPFPS